MLRLVMTNPVYPQSNLIGVSCIDFNRFKFIFLLLLKLNIIYGMFRNHYAD